MGEARNIFRWKRDIHLLPKDTVSYEDTSILEKHAACRERYFFRFGP
jgi:hypothetical protein